MRRTNGQIMPSLMYFQVGAIQHALPTMKDFQEPFGVWKLYVGVVDLMIQDLVLEEALVWHKLGWIQNRFQLFIIKVSVTEDQTMKITTHWLRKDLLKLDVQPTSVESALIKIKDFASLHWQHVLSIIYSIWQILQHHRTMRVKVVGHFQDFIGNIHTLESQQAVPWHSSI